MHKAIDDLLHEHVAIMDALRVLTGIAGKLENGRPTEEGDISDMLGFLKLFADRCHHGKEEGLLFPLLVMAGLSTEEGPIRVLLSEHARGRELIRAMESASFPKLNAGRFAAAVHGYVELLGSHIAKENTIVFPMAEKMLSPHQLDEIGNAFDDYEASIIGVGRHQELHTLLVTMLDRYAK